MAPLRALLLPFAWLYGLVLRVRHALYDHRILKSHRPAITSIVVGNLSFGGTGKTPHVELVLRSLTGLRLATLSRGYGRKGTGFREVTAGDDPTLVGDEPLQLKRKFPEVRVCVGADRTNALEHLANSSDRPEVVVLDDAYQHRRVQGHLNIVLTTWAKPWSEDRLVPAGTLRDIPVRGASAEMIVVTKCPEPPSNDEQRAWCDRLKLGSQQELFFSGLEYENARVLQPDGSLGGPVELLGQRCLVVTGIADPAPFVAHVRSLDHQAQHMTFPDHHAFTPVEVASMGDRLATFATPCMLVTTEKDAVRLLPHLNNGTLNGKPVAVIGIRAVILDRPERFLSLLEHHAGTHRTHS